MKITAKKALDALVAKGLAESWRKFRVKESPLKMLGRKGFDEFSVTSLKVNGAKFRLSSESWCKQSFLIFSFDTFEAACQVRDVLKEAGGKPRFIGWTCGEARERLQLQVYFFKASRWWEYEYGL